MKKIKEVYDWCCDTLFQESKNPQDWFVDSSVCSDCRYPLSNISFIIVGHPMKYCPGCGGFIDGIENPNPPIN